MNILKPNAIGVKQSFVKQGQMSMVSFLGLIIHNLKYNLSENMLVLAVSCSFRYISYISFENVHTKAKKNPLIGKCPN